MLSCGPSKENQALVRLQLVQAIYEKGDTLDALAHIDTIKRFYAEAVKQVQIAQAFEKEIKGQILLRKQIERDSIIKIITSFENKFIAEKTEFDRYTRYIHKRQNPETRWNKSYLQIHLNEIGELSLSSNYYGENWLNHTSIRVYDGDKQAKTGSVAVGDVLNHHGEFMKTKWERVTYMSDVEGGVIDFIAANAKLKLKAVYLGKQQYYIVLEDFDKQAAIDAVSFADALKKKRQLDAEIKTLQK